MNALRTNLPEARCRKLLGGVVHAMENQDGVMHVYCRPLTGMHHGYRWLPPETPVTCRACVRKARHDS